MDQVTIGNGRLTATIAARGAELLSLIPAWGGDVMWWGDPAIWASHAPNLFPIVGALADNLLIHQGRAYPMKQHGFLRPAICDIVSAEADSCAFQLADNDETRSQYPFAFVLTIAYRVTPETPRPHGEREGPIAQRWEGEGAGTNTASLAGGTIPSPSQPFGPGPSLSPLGRGNHDGLECCFELHNPADTPLYASIGAHPGFRWPLAGGDRAGHIVVFEKPEPEPIRRLDGRVLGLVPEPTPVEGRVLHLVDSLFDRDALIFDRIASRSVTFGKPGGPAVTVDFPDFPQLGIWTKPGASPYLCIEPWQGYASPAGFTGEFAEKPGVVALAPGETRNWRYRITPVERMEGV